MIDRLKVIMEKEGISPSQLADRLHVQRSGLSHILSGRNNPSLDFVKKVLTEFPQYDMEWFMFGNTNVNSEIYKSKQSKELSLFDDMPKSDVFSQPTSTKLNSAIHETVTEIHKSQSPTPEKTHTKKLIKVIMVYDNHTFEELRTEWE